METLDEQQAFLTGLGYEGAIEDMLLVYYNTQNSATDQALPDAQFKFFRGLGYTSDSIEDMLWANDSLFGPTGDSVFDTGVWNDSGIWDDTDIWADA